MSTGSVPNPHDSCAFEANRHREKYDQHARSAGLLLLEAKAEVAHGQWEAWLVEHGVKSRTAQRLMQEVKNPEAREERVQANREYNQTARPNVKTASTDAFEANPKPAPKATRTADIRHMWRFCGSSRLGFKCAPGQLRVSFK
jgi:hypothetical protein